jgi:hypothetical protein
MAEGFIKQIFAPTLQRGNVCAYETSALKTFGMVSIFRMYISENTFLAFHFMLLLLVQGQVEPTHLVPRYAYKTP